MKFGRLSDLVKNAKALSLDRAFRYSFSDKAITDYVIELNTDEQLFNNSTNNRGEIMDFYSEKTEELTRGESFGGKQKLAGEPWFFYDTGDFFKSFYISVGKDSITIIATDAEKMQHLFADIEAVDMLIGLTDESIKALLIELIPKLKEYILKTLLK